MDSDSKAIAVDEPGEHAGQAAGKMYTNNPMYKEKDVEGVIIQGDIKSGSAGTRYTMKKLTSVGRRNSTPATGRPLLHLA